MKTTNSSPGYTNARRVLSLLVIAVALAGPSRLWGQCPGGSGPTSWTVSVNPGTAIGNSQTVLTATITLNGVVPGPSPMLISVAVNGVAAAISTPLYYGNLVIPCGSSSGTVQFQVYGVSQTTTASFYAGGVTGNFQVTPNSPTLTVSPGTVYGASTQSVTGTITLAAALLASECVGVSASGGAGVSFPTLYYGECLPLGSGSSGGQFTMNFNGVTQTTTDTITAGSSSANVTVQPNGAVLTVSPGSVTGGSGQVVTGTVTMDAPVSTITNVGVGASQGAPISFSNLYYGTAAVVARGGTTAQFNLTAL